MGEIVEEIGNPRVVAIAENRLAPEMRLVVGKFPLDVLQPRVKLVRFRLLRVAQLLVAAFRHVSFLVSRAAERKEPATKKRAHSIDLILVGGA